jgi:hypothetical protein
MAFETTMPIRIEAALKDDVQTVAAAHFEGVQTRLFRDAVRWYVKMRLALGPYFEAEMADALARRSRIEAEAR